MEIWNKTGKNKKEMFEELKFKKCWKNTNQKQTKKLIYKMFRLQLNL